MYKRYYITCLFSFTLFSFSYATISEPLSFSNITAEQTGPVAVFKGANIKGAPGSPALPYTCYTYLLPPDADMNSIYVSF